MSAKSNAFFINVFFGSQQIFTHSFFFFPFPRSIRSKDCQSLMFLSLTYVIILFGFFFVYIYSRESEILLFPISSTLSNTMTIFDARWRVIRQATACRPLTPTRTLGDFFVEERRGANPGSHELCPKIKGPRQETSTNCHLVDVLLYFFNPNSYPPIFAEFRLKEMVSFSKIYQEMK